MGERFADVNIVNLSKVLEKVVAVQLQDHPNGNNLFEKFQYLHTMQIVWVTICLPVQESYGLGVKTVEKPFCPRLGTPVPLAMR